MQNHLRSCEMTVTPKRLPLELQVLGCVIALVLVAFAAIRLVGNSWIVRPQAAAETTVGTASAASTATPKERVRYQATIDNWQRYRAASGHN
jgi:hypothetical protein